ncbi:uncharacterized protein si:dkeyp-69c1.9 isoform X1 [Trematomus bernacchii]|uniref:uncharacterized protein si:dkeyp-69c1.9 isoform X1 n=2 Tax=Trematomus bernacchii TaxID=40690 RepID=UPI001469F39D|nr:uncharacterized protein si:dkeyp-69c1.9 isoform X1 [Trematomus bernacchii]
MKWLLYQTPTKQLVVQRAEPGAKTDKMFIQTARRQHDFFLRSPPYRGEPPTVAGFLLYPDTPAKMETTSREAFRSRTISQQDRGKGDNSASNTQQVSNRSLPTSSREAGRGSSRRDREAGEDEEGHNPDETAWTKKQETTYMQSQYQKDFPPPSSCRRRRTPALPQPDNIGINPAFRIDFSTVQREDYPGWPIMNPRRTGRSRQDNQT